VQAGNGLPRGRELYTRASYRMIEHLRYCNMSTREKITEPPHFLGIGPPKTATSWLYKSLAKHPNVNLPPLKEIGYLWEKSFLPKRSYMSRFLSRHWFYVGRRRYVLVAFRNHLRDLATLKIDGRKLRWDLNYSVMPHTDSWYRGLFDKDVISGDITPKYSELKEADIADIRSVFGEKKIVISARDPIEREWSRAKMNLCKKKNRDPNEVNEHEWIEHFDNTKQSWTNDYAALYERWAKVFGEENTSLIFFDEIERDAWTAFGRLCEFLGLDQLPVDFKKDIVNPANVGIGEPIPRRFEEYLLSKHRENIIRLSQRFPECSFPLDWLDRHEESVDKAS
jgi:hypothetical protein